MPKSVDLGVVDVMDSVRTVYGLRDGEEMGNEYRFLCVNPNHNETSPSCSVNLDTGYWHCFSCGVGGDFAELGVTVLGLGRQEVLDALSPGTADALITQVRSRLAGIQAYKPTKIVERVKLPRGYQPGPQTYMRSRGFKQSTLDRWGIQFAPEQELEGRKGAFTIRSSVAIPIRDEKGRLLCWCYRKTPSSPSWQPRYLYSDGIEVSQLWFGLQHVNRTQDITIVEGAIDTMWLDQCGITGLGLLGAGMTGGKIPAAKIMRLQRFRSLTLLGDRDQGGSSWVNAIGKALGNRMPIRVCQYSSFMKGTDPQELAPIDVELVHARSITWYDYRKRLEESSH